jgi:hypothetical protein
MDSPCNCRINSRCKDLNLYGTSPKAAIRGSRRHNLCTIPVSLDRQEALRLCSVRPYSNSLAVQRAFRHTFSKPSEKCIGRRAVTGKENVMRRMLRV